MAPRPRHPDKHLEALIRSLEEQGWRVEKVGRYYKAKCPCEDKHTVTIHITPRTHYLNHKKQDLRKKCWKE